MALFEKRYYKVHKGCESADEPDGFPSIYTDAKPRYLGVTFQLSAICAQPNDDNILRTLKNLPKDLPVTFDRILRRILSSDQFDPKFSRRLSNWLLHPSVL